MKLRSLVLIAAAASVILVVPAAHSGVRTTEPEVFEMVDVTLTDTKIVLSDKSARSEARASTSGSGTRARKITRFALLAASPVIISLDRQGFSTPAAQAGQDVGDLGLHGCPRHVRVSQPREGGSVEAAHARQVHGELTFSRAAAQGFAVAAAALLFTSCGGGKGASSDWPLPAADLEGTRAGSGSIDAGNAPKLHVRWRFRLTAKPSFSGIFASTPVADRRHGLRPGSPQQRVSRSTATRASCAGEHRSPRRNDGPNGLAVDGRARLRRHRPDAFALDAATGPRALAPASRPAPTEQFVDIAPGRLGGPRLRQHGRLPAAADAARSTRSTRRRERSAGSSTRSRSRGAIPLEAGGGGLWYPVSIDARRALCTAATRTRTPWGGTPEHPNGGAFPGPVLYTDSLLVLDARTGRLLWHDQVTPHDVRDYDFQATPILATRRRARRSCSAPARPGA